MMVFSALMILLGLFCANLGIADYHNPEKNKTLSAQLVFGWAMVIITYVIVLNSL